jgi:LysR family hydrogen peroxide-inducible transcriptional activator
VPELPRRVVAWVRRRRPGPSAATAAVARTLVEVVRTHADEQPGVHLGSELLPLQR